MYNMNLSLCLRSNTHSTKSTAQSIVGIIGEVHRIIRAVLTCRLFSVVIGRHYMYDQAGYLM